MLSAQKSAADDVLVKARVACEYENGGGAGAGAGAANILDSVVVVAAVICAIALEFLLPLFLWIFQEIAMDGRSRVEETGALG